MSRSQWQIVWLLAGGTPTAEVAQVTGSSVNRAREIARRYREGDPAGLGDRQHSNPGAPPSPDAAQQDNLPAALAGPVPDDGRWTRRSVPAWMGAALDRPVSEQRGWEWMRRLGFTPQRPRPRETRVDPEAQAAFKRGAHRRRRRGEPRSPGGHSHAVGRG